MFLDQSDGFDAIFSLTDKINFGKTLQQESELVARGFFVIDDNGVDGHVGDVTAANSERKAANVPSFRLRLSIGGGRQGRNCARDALIFHRILLEDFEVSETGRSVMMSAENGETMAKSKAQKARILRSKTIYSGPVFGIRRDELVEPGGVRTTREMITHSGSVVELPV